MKIAIICPHYGYIERGTEIFVKHMVNILKKRGHNIDIFGMGDYGVIPVKGLRIDKGMGKLWEGMTTKLQISGFFKKFIGIEPSISHFSYLLSLDTAFHPKNYDILWNNGELLGALFCNKIRKNYNIPFICTFHGNESMLMVREGLLDPNMFAVLTPQHKEYLVQKVQGNIQCIPNGVDLDVYRPDIQPLKEYGISTLEHPIFLSTSALIPSKRVELIVKAVAQLERGSLIISSTGSSKKQVLELADKMLQGRYSYIGVIPFEELPALYNSCDIYVNASRAEGHSLALLEALGCNRPVVSHDDANRRWSIGDAGMVTDVTNIDKFAASLKTVYGKKWENIPRKQAEQFSWEKTADRYEQSMGEILNGQ